MTATIDQTIQTLFSKLNQRKQKVSELKSKISKSWKTNGNFALGAVRINLQTAPITDLEDIIVLFSGHVAASAAARERFPDFPFRDKFNGYSEDDWVHDFNKRLATLSLKEEETALNSLESRLNQVLSPEERRRIEVELLAKELV